MIEKPMLLTVLMTYEKPRNVVKNRALSTFSLLNPPTNKEGGISTMTGESRLFFFIQVAHTGEIHIEKVFIIRAMIEWNLLKYTLFLFWKEI